jgi:hypothetical protein
VGLHAPSPLLVTGRKVHGLANILRLLECEFVGYGDDGQLGGWACSSYVVSGQTLLVDVETQPLPEPISVPVPANYGPTPVALDWAVLPTLPTPTPTPTPATCTASIHDPLLPPWERVNVRALANGLIIGSFAQGTEINLIDGYTDEYSVWWWHVLEQVTEIEGCVIGNSVVNFNNCPQIEVVPPPPPQPQPSEVCLVDLQQNSAEVRDGSGEQGALLRTITTAVDNLRVYGTNYGLDLLLISPPGVMPQEWVDRSRFMPDSDHTRACQNYVLGRFKRDTRPEYWTAVGVYANTFRAPVSSTQYNAEYALFRNSYHFTPNPEAPHTGTDLVYGPPNGRGDATNFDVYAQGNGVIVDAGPDGVTRAYQLERDYGTPEEPVLAAPANRYARRAGVFYWTTPIPANSPNPYGFHVTYYVAMIGSEDDDPQNDVPERPNSGAYSRGFGITATELELLHQEGFTQISERCNGEFGCIEGPGRQIVIWYEVADDEPSGPNRPEFQTIYYHIAVDELPRYVQLKSLCSADRNATWAAVIAGNPAYDICRITTAFTPDGSALGRTRQIGFADVPHLHYEIYVDRDNNGQFERASDDALNDLEDPLMAFATIR